MSTLEKKKRGRNNTGCCEKEDSIIHTSEAPCSAVQQEDGLTQILLHNTNKTQHNANPYYNTIEIKWNWTCFIILCFCVCHWND